MPTIAYTLTRGDDEITLEVDYTVAPFDPGCSFGPPEFCDPPSGGEIEDLFIAGPDGAEFTPTAAELEQIERHIYDTHDYSEEPDYD
jgi:hypothetical protein